MDKLKRIEELQAEIDRLQLEVEKDNNDMWNGKIIRIEEPQYNKVTFFHVESLGERYATGTSIWFNSNSNYIDDDVCKDKFELFDLCAGTEVRIEDVQLELLKISSEAIFDLLSTYKDEWS